MLDRGFSFLPCEASKPALPPIPKRRYDIVHIDPPWGRFVTKSHGISGMPATQTDADAVNSIPMREVLTDRGAVFVWATGLKLDRAIDAIRSWGLHYRGIAFVWITTIGEFGSPPQKDQKPSPELLLLVTARPKGRPFPLLDNDTPQVVMAPITDHGEKPDQFRLLIEKLCGERKRIEMF